MNILGLAIILIASIAITRLLTPKPPGPKAGSLEDFTLPTAEAGRPIAWVFGTRRVKSPNIIWYGDLKTHKGSTTGTMKYWLGIHMEVCIGPVDSVTRFWYGDRVCWSGSVTESRQIHIDNASLFGGRKKEGGIEGKFDLCFGEPDQDVNDYLSAQLGLPLSAFRDSLTVVGRQPYLTANSTYIKALQPLVTRIRKGWPDDDCWYPEKAASGFVASDAYTRYVTGRDGGPKLSYRWTMSSGFDHLGAEEEHQGAASGSMKLRNEVGTVDGHGHPGTLAHQDPVTMGTVDRQSVTTTGWTSGRFSAPYWVGGPGSAQAVTIGFWFNPAGGINTDNGSEFWMFTTQRVEPADGKYYGLHAGMYNDGTLSFQIGSGTDGGWTDRISFLSTEPAPENLSGMLHKPHFAVVVLRPGAGKYVLGTGETTADMTGPWLAAFDFWLDGKKYDFYRPGGTAGGGATSVTLNPGVAGQVNRVDFFNHLGSHHLGIVGGIDEPFIHLGELSDRHIQRMWEIGNGADGTDDMNPAHMIYNAWADYHQGMGYPRSMIDDAAMRYAANTFYAEGFGLSLIWGKASKIEDFVAEVCRHASALQSINPRTGELQIIPLRDDYDSDAIPVLTEDDCIEVVDWQEGSDSETPNTITVKYEDRDGNEQAVTYTNRALVQQYGVIAQVVEYPGIATNQLALRVAKRDAKQARVRAKGKLKLNRVAWDLMPGKVFKFSHAPEGIGEIILRVLEWDSGTLESGGITVTVAHDVFAAPPLEVPETADVVSEWEPPAIEPEAVQIQDAMEAPYWALRSILGPSDTAALPSDRGYIIPLGVPPNGATNGADVWTRIDPDPYQETSSDQDLVGGGRLKNAIGAQDDTGIELVGLMGLDDDTSGIIQIGTGRDAELCQYSNIDVDAGTIDLVRGILDTVAAPTWPANTPVFILDPRPDLWPFDPTRWTDGDEVDVKLAASSAGGVLDIADATEMTVEMQSRQIRPYAPANLKIDGSYNPDTIGDAWELTWRTRGRISQADSVVGYFTDQDETPDSGQTSVVRVVAILDDNSETELLLDDVGTDTDRTITTSAELTLPPDTIALRAEVFSERDGLESWQRSAITVSLINPPYNLRGTYYPED